MKPVEHIKTRKNMTVNELVIEMNKSGVMGAGSLAKAVDIAEKMIKEDCKLFFGLAGAMVPGGMKQIIVNMLEDGWIDVFVSTGANLTHDLIEALGYKHYHGLNLDDIELHRKGFDRIYNSFMSNKVYEGLEKFCQTAFKKMPKKNMNIKEFLWLLGKYSPEKSMLRICYKKKIPIFCPALSDSGIGLQVWNFIQDNKINVDAFDDLKEIIDISWSSKIKAVFYVGGGTPKNYIQQAMQISEPARYGIQITMDRPEHGGSSGAPLKEGISWGKMSEKGEFVDVICDATIALPIIHAALKERIE